MRRAILFCLLLSAATAQARLDETVKDIETRYGKPLQGVKAESPATVAGLYVKNGFRVTVGFYQNKVYYEKFQKLDPKKPNSYLEINDTERESLLKANCKGCDWVGHNAEEPSFDGGHFGSIVKTTYDRSDGLAHANYDNHSMILVVRSLVYEKQKEADEKRRQQENLKGF
jgi:hypothetical protein